MIPLQKKKIKKWYGMLMQLKIVANNVLWGSLKMLKVILS